MPSIAGGQGINQVEDKKGHSKQGGQQGQEPEGVKEYGKSQGSEWPSVVGVGVPVGDEAGGEWEPPHLLLGLPRSPARVDCSLSRAGPL